MKLQEATIAQRIFEIRGKKVMLSGDLAELYQVETKALNQQVKRNLKRFPPRYMFKLTLEEYHKVLRSQNVTLERGQHSKYPPYAFTEHGILMLSSVLRSERADKINVLIMDTFIEIREILNSHSELQSAIDSIQENVSSHDRQIILLFNHLKKFLGDKQGRVDQASRKRIGYN